MLRRLLKNYFVVLIGTLAGQILTFFGITYVARMFGPAVFGPWNFAQTYVMYLFRLNEMGLEVIGIKKVSSGSESIPEIVSNVIVMRIILALALLGMTMAFVVWDIFPYGTGLLILICSVSVLPVALTVEWVFESVMELNAVMVSRFVKGLLFFLLVIVFVVDGDDAPIAMSMYVLSIGIPSVVLLGYVIFKYRVRFDINLRKSAALLKESLPIGAATLVSNYNLFIGTFLLTYMISAESLGHYSAAQRIVVLLGALTVSNAHRILLPVLYRSFANSFDSFQSALSMFFRGVAVVAFLFALMLIAIAGDMIPLVFGPSFRESIDVFVLLSASLTFYLLRSVLEIGYIASNVDRRYLYSNIVAAVLSTILIPVLVLRYGIVGAGYAAILAECGTLVFQIARYRLLPFLFSVSSIGKPAIAFCLGFGAEFYLRTAAPAVHYTVPFVAYGAVLFLTQAVSREDIRILGMQLSAKEDR